MRSTSLCTCIILSFSRAAFAKDSLNLTENSSSPSPTTAVNKDLHGGVYNAFDIALHDPSIALVASDAQHEVTCPAALAWNQRYARNTTTDQTTDEERETQWIVSYMDKHPDQTLWDLFTKTLDEDVKNWLNGPHPVETAADTVVEFTADVIKEFVMMLWAAFKWVVKFPFEPKKEWKQVEDLGAELWDGSKLAAGLFAKNAMDGLKTVTGGLFLHLLLHPAEFTAESILLVGAGFQVIHGLIHGMEAIAGSFPPAVGQTVMSVLMFIHMLDDPLLILTPIFTNTAQAVQAVKSSATVSGNDEEDGGFTSNDGTNSITLPPQTIIAAAPTCPLLPPDVGAPPLTYAKLCLTSDPTQVRKIIFGTVKPSTNMSREERLDAYTHVRKFWCCYGQGAKLSLPDSVLQDVAGREQWEGKSFWEDMEDCQRLLGASPHPTTGRLTIGLSKD